MTSFFAALGTIGQILKLAREIIAWIDANKNEQWFQDSVKVFSELRAAETAEQKKDVAKKLRDIVAGLG